jgi:hypothetical protein
MTRYPPMSLVVLAIAACGQNSGSDDVCPADEIGDQSPDDTGDDGGCQFLPECNDDEDEGPSEKFDLQPDTDLDCTPDCPLPEGLPTPLPPQTYPTWLIDTNTGTYYRFASEAELEVNGWAESTILLSAESTVDALVNGTTAPVTFGLPVVDPTGEIQITPVSINRKATYHDVWYVTAEDAVVGPMVDAFRPDFHLFLPNWVNLNRLVRPVGTDAFMWAFGDSHGGVTVQAITATQEVFIAGPTVGVWLETLPPGDYGVLVATPKFDSIDFGGLMDHWEDVVGGFCAANVCSWAANADDEAANEMENCSDGLDNDADCQIDGNDLACKHRNDFGCDTMAAHNHRWEDSKDFAILPDIEWCTSMKAQGMPWHSILYTEGTTAAALLNAVPMAFLHFKDDWQLAGELPPGIPSIHYRFAYCVFAPSVEDAVDCRNDAEACPEQYQLGGLGPLLQVTLPTEPVDAEQTAYFEALWREYDVAASRGATVGVTPKPVALLTGVWSGDIVGDDLMQNTVGLAGSIGDLEYHEIPRKPKVLGASVVEGNFLTYLRVAHEHGHSLGLSHTANADPNPGNDLFGFMAGALSQPFAVLGPSADPPGTTGYGAPDQWTLWQTLIGDKGIPRPNGFGASGCTGDPDCAGVGFCWNPGALGVCWQ